MSKKATPTSRRRFLGTALAGAGAAAPAPTIIPSTALGLDGAVAPSERVVVGGIGIGNRGTYDLGCFLGQPDVQFVAVCDIKQKRRVAVKKIADAKNGNQNCATYRDFRELLDRSDIDAVLIATGPNWHATAAMTAAKAGKDMYCEKPCTKNIAQSLILKDTMRRTGRVFQAGTQRRNLPHFAFACELARTGKLGKLKKVFAHPAGMQAMMSGWLPAQKEPDKEVVDWNMYLGPAAWRPFNAKLLDGFNFEKGGGLVGGGVLEWGSHCVDLCQWAVDDCPPPTEYNAPKDGQLVARYDNGTELIFREKGWIPLGSCPVRFEGEDGWVEAGDSGKLVLSSPALLAGRTVAEIGGYPATFHVRDFLDCVKTRRQPKGNADAACNAHIACHAANIALHLGRQVKYDITKHEFINDEQANRLRSERFENRGGCKDRHFSFNELTPSSTFRTDTMHSTRPTKRILILLSALSLMASLANAQDAANKSSEKETQLLAVLRSDAPAADKALTCKRLAIHGTSKAVPDLASLLPNPQLSSWARIALESIPGAAADEALRQATDSLEGELLVGTINSIGVRQDAKAVERLTELLGQKNVQVASAAAVALGRIGNADATKSLRAALATENTAVRSAVAEGCVLCAERLHASGKAADAIALYDQVRQAQVPTQRKIEATRGAILARKQEGIPLLLELFRSEDKKMFQLALSTAREFPGGNVDKALADELARATTPQRAALMIQAMADRPQTVVLTAVMKAAEQGPKQVRMSAVDALGRVGDASCLSTLLDIALDADAELAQSAKQALAGLTSQKVDAQIVTLLRKAEGKSYGLLLELVGQRRIAAVSDLLKALDHTEQSVRAAALSALGETAGLKQLPVLVSAFTAPRNPEDAAVAQRALRAASVRMPDREACARELAAALQRAPTAAKSVLLEIIGEVGGTKALQTLAQAAKSEDDQLQDTASRLLGKWNGVDAAPVLLDLAKTAPAAKYRIRAMRGYIGLARKFAMPEPQRVEMCRKALDTATRPADQKLVLEVLKLRPSSEALSLAVKTMQVPELKDDATQAVLIIAQKLTGKVDVSQQLAKAGFERIKLEIIKAEYGAGSNQRDVTALIRKYAGDLPLIILPNASYNASLGGDPVSGSVKRLKIRYRINGQQADASFAENSLIILPRK